MLDHAPTVRLTAAAANVAELRMRLLYRTAADTAGQSRNDGALSYGRAMAKAARILAALKRDGWMETRRSGSHRVLVKGDQQRIWAYHDGVDLGGPAMARIARDYGYTVDELRKL
jgi:predicted RNA binding protein YcfA (HicA-like mRNA interferase family)